MSSGDKRPIAEVLPLAEALLEQLRPFCERLELAGSLRRKVKLVGDIELVAIPKRRPDLFGQPGQASLLWEKLDSLVGREYFRAGEKYRAFEWKNAAEKIKVDLFTAEPENFGLIYLIRTGSADFSHHVVKKLADVCYPSHGGWVRRAPGRWDWSDKEKDGFEKIETPTEEKVFEYARIPYRTPEQRH